MISLVIDLNKAVTQRRAHTRRTRGGQISAVRPTLVHDARTKKVKVRSIMGRSLMGKMFSGDKLPQKGIQEFLVALGVDAPAVSFPEGVIRENVEVDLTGDVDTHWIMRYKKRPFVKGTRERREEEKWTHVYTKEWDRVQDAKKWERVKKLDPLLEDASAKFRSYMLDESLTLREREASAMLYIITKTAFRIGNTSDYNMTGNRATSTLAPGSVQITGDKCYFNFIGKLGMKNSDTIIDAGLAKFLSARKANAQRGKFLWQYPTLTYIERMKERAGIGEFKTHDIRYLISNRIAAEEFAQKKAKFPKGDERKMKKVLNQRVREVGLRCAIKLNEWAKKGTEPGAATALKYYVNPALIQAWVESVGGDPDLVTALHKSLSPRAQKLWDRALQITLPGHAAQVQYPDVDDDDEPREGLVASPEEIEKSIFVVKARKPYGHVEYERRDPRTGKMVQVKAKGSKPMESKTHSGTGLPMNPDGSVTLYHGTSGDKAKNIVGSGKLVSEAERDVYLTTEQQPNTGYGDTVVAVDVDPEHLELDDEFPGGRKDYRVATGSDRSYAVKNARVHSGEPNQGASGKLQRKGSAQKKKSSKKKDGVSFTPENLDDFISNFSENVGFHIDVEEIEGAAARVATVHAIVKTIEGIGHVFDIGDELREIVFQAEEEYDGSNASYDEVDKVLAINSEYGRHSIYHEMGHAVDNLLGGWGEKFATSSKKKPKDVAAWLAAVKETDSFKRWKKQDPGYLDMPEEMFARYFDQWCNTRLQEKGLDPEDYYSDLTEYTYDRELYDDADFDSLRPTFEKIVSKHMKKSLVLRSLLGDGAHVGKPHHHISAVKDGHPVRAPGHKKEDDLDHHGWYSDNCEALIRFAVKETGGDFDSGEYDTAAASAWLEQRDITLPKFGVDDIDDETKKLWLHRMGEVAFPLGVYLVGLKGETLTQPRELPKLKKAILTMDLTKARTVGALGKKKGAGHRGAIAYGPERNLDYISQALFNDPTALEKNIEKKRKKYGYAEYIPPDPKLLMQHLRKLSRQKREKFHEVMGLGRAEAALEESKLRAEGKHVKVPLTIRREMKYIDPRREAGDLMEGIEFLRAKVADWAPPKEKLEIDPIFEEEYKDLVSQARSLALKIPGKTRREKVLVRSPESQQYREILYRMRQISIRTKYQPGDAAHSLGAEDVEVISQLPHIDLGFHPAQKPMTYLLSLGWHKKDREGGNLFNDNEYRALRHEFGHFVFNQANKVANAVGFHRVRDPNTGEMKSTDDRESIKAEAETLLFESARRWDPDKRREEHGGPGPGNNFAAWFYATFPIRLKDFAVDRAKQMGVEEVWAEELEEMPDRYKEQKVLGAKFENPEEFFRRMQTDRGIQDALKEILKPYEYATVMARLNVLNKQAEGIYTEKKHKVPREGKTLVVELGDVKGWGAVKQDAVDHISRVYLPGQEQDVEVGRLKKLPEKYFHDTFDQALKKLRNAPDRGGLSPDTTRTLAEFASMQRLFLEGLRHEMWSPDPPAITKLKVTPEKVTERDIAAMEKRYRAVAASIKQTKPSHKAAREKLLNKKREIARELSRMRSEMKALHKDPDIGRVQIKPFSSGMMQVNKFWDKHSGLAARFSIGDKYRDIITSPNVLTGTKHHYDKLKAQAYHGLIKELLGKTTPKLRGLLHRHHLETPSSIKLGGKTVNLHVPTDDYKAMIEFALAQQAEKSSVSKSFVVLDYYGAIDGLIEECKLWEMNGY